jgi:hypothetical protein
LCRQRIAVFLSRHIGALRSGGAQRCGTSGGLQQRAARYRKAGQFRLVEQVLLHERRIGLFGLFGLLVAPHRSALFGELLLDAHVRE